MNLTPSELIKMGVEAKSYPQFLFKYRADNTFTEKIISDNELYFSDPRIFNDPYDCNTPINTNTSLDDIKDWLRSVGIAPTNIDKCADLVQRNPNWMKDATDDALSKTGVCCFSTIDDSILQWSHYSEFHKGICLKFDITEDPDFFFIPVIVSYRKVMQHYNHFTQSSKIVEYLIQPKFSEWAYESEVRIVKPEPLMKESSNNRAFRYKNQALREVIFGAKTSDAVKQKYIDLCANHNKLHVQFFEMQLDNGVHYKLNKI